MKLLTTLFLPILALVSLSNTYAKDPAFQDYPATVYTGSKAPLKLNKDTQSFKTRFKELSNSEINFAGHYAIDFAGCGTGCVVGLMYNAKTGHSQYLPSLTYCRIGERMLDLDMEYHANSRLLILTGANDDTLPCGKHYFIEHNGKLKKHKSIRFKESDIPLES